MADDCETSSESRGAARVERLCRHCTAGPGAVAGETAGLRPRAASANNNNNNNNSSETAPTTRPVCLVVGAGAGIGQAVARRFAEEGFHACCVRRGGGPGSISGDDAKQRLEDFCAELRSEGHHASALFADATKPEEISALVKMVEQDLGPIDVAVYNVGAQVGNRLLENTSYRIFELAWRMGTLGAFALAKEVAPFMVGRGTGTVILTSATAAVRGNMGQHAHTAAMAGRRALGQSLNHELGRLGIHVCMVNIDGPVESPDTLGRMMPELYKKLLAEKGPQEKILLPKSVADTYYMLHCQRRDAWTLEMDLRPWGEAAWFNSDDRPL
ncbi:unnamed protein product [Polarella glacialis]|uniref:Uncharacterized protein n=1 Tax=Polarella glacialis TaxID=89957 RepID=A0A813H8L5_POLGL|nr:unnamed protein product [Polarella glacialis]